MSSKVKRYISALCGGILIIFFSLFNDYSNQINGEVIKVYDGDTITLNVLGKKEKIRLYGIDSPELKQEYGKESKNHLLKLCPINTMAKVKVVDTDKYNRKVGIVYCNDIDVNKEQVRNGFAWSYKEFSNIYTNDEKLAKTEKIGLWQSNNPINPQDYRRK